MKKIKVLFNIRCLSDSSLRGISRYTKELLNQFDYGQIELYLVSDRDVHLAHIEDVPYKELIVKKMNYFLWEQLWVPFFATKNKITIYHNPNNFGTPVLGWFKKINTVHDAIDLHNKNNLSAKIKFLYQLTRLFTSKLITVSNYSKHDVANLLDYSESQIEVIYEAGNLKRTELTIEESTTRYFLYIGGWEGRKNIKFLIRAFEKIEDKSIKLILAGEKNENIFQEIEGLVKDLNIENRVELKSWISNEELQKLYSNAFCFVYPSLFEGFGLQILEAMEFNIPVICSDRTSLPEIHGMKEATFSPDNENTLIDRLNSLVDDAEFREKLIEHSKNRKTQFSWKRTAAKTLDFYHKLI